MRTRLGIAALTLTVAALAADVTGKWTAEIQGRDGQTRVQTFEFKQDGDKLTGTISSPMGQREISDGKVSGDTISFTVTFEAGGNQFKMNYTGQVVGNEIRFKVEGGPRSREFVAKRAES